MRKNIFQVIIIFLTIVAFGGCTFNNDKVLFRYHFKQNTKHNSTQNLNILLNVNKIMLPPSTDVKINTDSKQNNKDSILLNFREMFAADEIKTIEFNLSTDKEATISIIKEDTADIYQKNKIGKVLFKVNDKEQSLGSNIFNLLLAIIETENIVKLNSNGERFNLPIILGQDLSKINNPYFNKIFSYSKRISVFPKEEIAIGYKWNDSLKITIPFDSITQGQSQGYICFDTYIKKEFVKMENSIANIKIDMITQLNWDITIPDQGSTKCDLTITSSGFQFFDIINKWNHGTLLKGTIELKINALTIDNKDKNKKVPVIFDVLGNYEFAYKIK